MALALELPDGGGATAAIDNLVGENKTVSPAARRGGR